MRAGAIISAFAHAAVLLVWVMFGTPRPFDDARSEEPVAVDLVTPEEVQAETPKPPEEPKPPEPKPPEAKPEPPPPPLVPPRPDRITERPTPLPPQAQTKASPPPPAARQQPPAAAPSAAAPAQPSPETPAQPPPQQQPPPSAAPSIFDPASIPKLAEIAPPPPAPSTPSIGFDSAAMETANLSREDVAAFKSHLKKCLKLPAGMDASRNVRVVMRVFLRTDGALASDPMLIEASAAREGPGLVQAATEALKACQPYAFLPPEKYNEWKILDLPFTPRDMAGS